MNWVTGNHGYLPMVITDFTDDKFGKAKAFILCFIVFTVMKWFCMIFVVDRVEHLTFAGVIGELEDEQCDRKRSLFFNPHPVHTKGNHVDVLIGNHPNELLGNLDINIGGEVQLNIGGSLNINGVNINLDQN